MRIPASAGHHRAESVNQGLVQRTGRLAQLSSEDARPQTFRMSVVMREGFARRTPPKLLPATRRPWNRATRHDNRPPCHGELHARGPIAGGIRERQAAAPPAAYPPRPRLRMGSRPDAGRKRVRDARTRGGGTPVLEASGRPPGIGTCPSPGPRLARARTRTPEYGGTGPTEDLQMTDRAAKRGTLNGLEDEVTRCRACPRLVAWRESVARKKRAAFRDDEYWGRPVPGFGDPHARLLIIGLAPAAHGANRTGRMFTGDRSGDWLYDALHRFGFASTPHSTGRDDGLRLDDAYITATVRCAPPNNRPRPGERDRCRRFLERELDHFLPRLRCLVPLGQYAFDHTLRLLRGRGIHIPSPAPGFGHGRELALEGNRLILASYHPSQQNTFTGRLTRDAFARIWRRAREHVDSCDASKEGLGREAGSIADRK